MKWTGNKRAFAGSPDLEHSSQPGGCPRRSNRWIGLAAVASLLLLLAVPGWARAMESCPTPTSCCDLMDRCGVPDVGTGVCQVGQFSCASKSSSVAAVVGGLPEIRYDLIHPYMGAGPLPVGVLRFLIKQQASLALVSARAGRVSLWRDTPAYLQYQRLTL